MAARNTSPGRPMALPIIAVAVILAGLAVLNGLPGLILLPVGLFVAAFTYPQVAATGRKDSRGAPQPANPTEAAQIARWRYWTSMKSGMFSGLGPGWPVRFSFAGTVLAAVAAYQLLPIDLSVATGRFEGLAPVLQNGQLLNGLGALLALAALDNANRNATGEVPSPGVGHDAVIKAVRTSWVRPTVFAVVGAAFGAGAAGVAVALRPVWSRLLGDPAGENWLIITLGAVSGLLVGAYACVRSEALARHRRLAEGTAQWGPRWQMLKEDPSPRLIERTEYASGPVVDTFEADGSRGSAAYVPMAPKIAPTLGNGMSAMVLEVHDIGTDGQPMEGTRHGTRFDIVSVPAGWGPDVSDPATPEEDVELAARMALASACDTGGLVPRYVFNGIERLTVPPKVVAKPKPRAVNTAVEGQVLAWNETPDEDDPADQGNDQQSSGDGPQAFALKWGRTSEAVEFRNRAKGIFASIVQAPTLVDHRANNKDGLCVFGGLDGATWDNQLGVDDTFIYRASEEDGWNARWEQASSKIGPNAPVPEFNVEMTASLADGTEVNQMAFLSRQGVTVDKLFEVEPAFPTVLNAAPFVSMTGWPDETGRPGSRHHMAVTLHWSSSPVPARPDDLKPVNGSEAPKWVLAGLVNSAFRDARLPRPELATATAMTLPGSRKQIWKMHVRLYGGSFSQVRHAMHAIRQSWGSQWVRVQEAQEGCYIYAGGDPSGPGVRLANPRRDKEKLASLDWAQVFNDSGLAGIDGRLPKLMSVDHLPKNEQVEVLEFDLESTGLNYSRFKEARTKMEANADKAYVEPRPVKNAPSRVVLYASKEHPMPEMAPFDWAAIDASEGYPFATTVEGEPVAFIPRKHMHAMVVGGSGSGKSVVLQGLITGALRRGHELFIGDPTKGAADFLFAEPYAAAVTRDLLSTLAMMRGLYQEVSRRVRLNSSHGAGSYRDLPEEVRPNHILLVLDEFVSMITQDKVSRTAAEDPDVELDREFALAENAAKAEIGAITGKIAREARSAGVTMLLATQKLTANDLASIPGGNSLKVNLSRIVVGKSTHGERMSALKDASKAPELGEFVPAGRGIFESTTDAPILMQGWYEPGEQQALGSYVAAHRTPLPEGGKLALEQWMPKMPGQEEAPALPNNPFASFTTASGPADGGDSEVVDLGTMELTLEDLDISLDDLEGDETDPSTEESAAPFTAPATGFAGEVLQTLTESGATGSLEDVVLVGSGLGLSPWVRTVDLDDHRGAEDGWWQAAALQAWVGQDPRAGGERIIFADAELDDEDPVFGLPVSELAAEVLEGTDHLLLSPAGDWQDQVLTWAASVPDAEQTSSAAPQDPVMDGPEVPVAESSRAPEFDFPEDDGWTGFDSESSTIPSPEPAPVLEATPAPAPASVDGLFDDDIEVPERLRRARELKAKVLNGGHI